MKTHGMLFKSEMVRAIQQNRKTVTRRLQGLDDVNHSLTRPSILNQEIKYDSRYWVNFKFNMFSAWKECKYAPGDLIYAKETFWKNSHPHVHFTGENIKTQDEVTWRADSDQAVDQKDYEVRPGTWLPNCKWTSSIFMPKALSRIWLRVIDVRCERLQEITERDAIDEGCSRTERAEGAYYLGGVHKIKGTRKVFNCARGAYADLWDSINTDFGTQWDSNPFVFRIAFERIEKPTLQS